MYRALYRTIPRVFRVSGQREPARQTDVETIKKTRSNGESPRKRYSSTGLVNYRGIPGREEATRESSRSVARDGPRGTRVGTIERSRVNHPGNGQKGTRIFAVPIFRPPLNVFLCATAFTRCRARPFLRISEHSSFDLEQVSSTNLYRAGRRKTNNCGRSDF